MALMSRDIRLREKSPPSLLSSILQVPHNPFIISQLLGRGALGWFPLQRGEPGFDRFDALDHIP